MDGTELEIFVAGLEALLLPSGVTVELRSREYSREGVQIAEFDIVTIGRLGSAKVACLIECRDRPSEGAAPAAWIEQLVGRRLRFGFDKVIAVSTTGFAPGSIEYARQSGIELRTVTRLSAADVFQWFRAQELEIVNRSVHLTYAKIMVAENEPNERREAAYAAIRDCTLNEAILFNPVTRMSVLPVDAFMAAVGRRPHLWPKDVRSQWSDEVEIDAGYPIGNQYEVVTKIGPVLIPRILFKGVLMLHPTAVPFTKFTEYADELTGTRISSSVAADVSLAGQLHTITLDRISIDAAEMLSFRVQKRS